MRPDLLALMRARDHIVEWLTKLEPRLSDDGDPEIRREYVSLTATLAAIMPRLAPEAIAPFLTQQELAACFDVSTRTVRRRVASGALPSKREDRRWAR